MRAALAFAVLVLAGCPYDGRELAAPDGPPTQPPADAPPGTPDATPGTPDAMPDDDLDDDGIVNAVVNCPVIANPLQRDHDTDGHGDECDRCPHLTDPADPDTDGDGVGDACDPRGGLADTRVAFYGFYDPSEVVGWGPNTDWQVTGGQLVRTGITGTSSFGSIAPVHNPYVASHATVTAIAATSDYSVGVSVAVTQTPAQYYSCYRNRGTNTGGPYVIDAYAAIWPGDNDFDYHNGVGTLIVGTQLDFVDWMTVGGSHCAISGIDRTKHGGTDGAAVVWTDDLTAAYDYMFVVSVGD